VSPITLIDSAIAGYFLGSIPFGFLIAKTKGMDIRQHGSGNIGATNVWRVCGWRYGLPVFILDVMKGVIAVVIAGYFEVRIGGCQGWAQIVAAFACIVGHSFPIWLKFKGGKGVATSLGVMLGIMPSATLVVFALWAIIFKISGYVSLASVVAAIALPIVVLVGSFTGWNFGWPAFWFSAVAGLLVVLRHKSNIQRLIAGTESRIGQKGKES